MIDILIIDDDKDILSFLEELFDLNGFTVQVTDRPENALILIENNEYRLVITDVMMPIISGIEVAKKIRKMNDKTKIIIMTGYTSEIADLDNISDGFIKKPFELDEIVDLVKKCI